MQTLPKLVIPNDDVRILAVPSRLYRKNNRLMMIGVKRLIPTKEALPRFVPKVFSIELDDYN